MLRGVIKITTSRFRNLACLKIRHFREEITILPLKSPNLHLATAVVFHVPKIELIQEAVTLASKSFVTSVAGGHVVGITVLDGIPILQVTNISHLFKLSSKAPWIGVYVNCYSRWTKNQLQIYKRQKGSHSSTPFLLATLPETNIAPEKNGIPKGKLVFQNIKCSGARLVSGSSRGIFLCYPNSAKALLASSRPLPLS